MAMGGFLELDRGVGWDGGRWMGGMGEWWTLFNWSDFWLSWKKEKLDHFTLAWSWMGGDGEGWGVVKGDCQGRLWLSGLTILLCYILWYVVVHSMVHIVEYLWCCSALQWCVGFQCPLYYLGDVDIFWYSKLALHRRDAFNSSTNRKHTKML